MSGSEKIRVDKWLWFARFFKSRTLAAEFCGSGKLRCSGAVVAKPGHTVRIGDVLTFPLGLHIRVIKVLELGERRGPAPEARTLYEDLQPPEPETAMPRDAVRPRGEGRPTKRDRRAIDKFREEEA